MSKTMIPDNVVAQAIYEGYDHGLPIAFKPGDTLMPTLVMRADAEGNRLFQFICREVDDVRLGGQVDVTEAIKVLKRAVSDINSVISHLENIPH